MTSEPVREAVGVFPDEPSLRAAGGEVLISGFDRSDISVVAGRRSVERKLGAMYDGVAELEDDPEAPGGARGSCSRCCTPGPDFVGDVSHDMRFMDKIGL